MIDAIQSRQVPQYADGGSTGKGLPHSSSVSTSPDMVEILVQIRDLLRSYLQKERNISIGDNQILAFMQRFDEIDTASGGVLKT